MKDRKPNAMLLVAWALAGAALAALTWLFSFLPIPQLPVHGTSFWDLLWMNLLRSIALFIPFVLGVTVSRLAVRRFKRGLDAAVWSEAQLEPVRTLVTKPVWTWATAALFVALALSVIFSVRTGHLGGGGFVYLLFFPIQTMSRIRYLLNPRAASNEALTDWGSSEPLQSDRWGQPPVHPSA
jgi:hypothetical protein